MNKTQKYFVIIGVTSFLYWFMKPLPWNGGYPIYSMIWHQFILGLDFSFISVPKKHNIHIILNILPNKKYFIYIIRLK